MSCIKNYKFNYTFGFQCIVCWGGGPTHTFVDMFIDDMTCKIGGKNLQGLVDLDLLLVKMLVWTLIYMNGNYTIYLSSNFFFFAYFGDCNKMLLLI